MGNNWRHRTLQELEDKDDGLANNTYSNLVNKCLTLRRIPLIQFNIEDLRLMINQQQGLVYLVPLAIEILKDNVLAEGDLYEGDLLESVLNIDQGFWKQNNKLMSEIQKLIDTNIELLTAKKRLHAVMRFPA